jgi:hypothetical protein
MFRRKTLVIKILLTLLILTTTAGIAQTPDAQYGKSGPALLPDPKVTPGHVAITDATVVCKTKWGTDARHVTTRMKNEVYRTYGTARKVEKLVRCTAVISPDNPKAPG